MIDGNVEAASHGTGTAIDRSSSLPLVTDEKLISTLLPGEL
eukprot:CAMPEP_0201921656 /NCGR_PEP_ID=MMETSP0903-20130614/9926_1 /ASSEMBLY_ACC=CAM_ASM_000552 /TAXON_ID=420261 /ORGANISM="Thalassiosira antarctica, Strain CCMP982" /LENGTH=40 /DNA_ID= /DNA_START= /DNA_END= /DNA_ORIENTATION=